MVSVSHYNDVIMGTIASQITSLTIVYSTVYSGADQSKHQSSASLAFMWGIHRGPVNSPQKWPVTRKMFPFDDVIMPRFFQSLLRYRNVLPTTIRIGEIHKKDKLRQLSCSFCASTEIRLVISPADVSFREAAVRRRDYGKREKNNLLAPGRCGCDYKSIIFKLIIQNSIAWVLVVKLLSGECYGVSLIRKIVASFAVNIVFQNCRVDFEDVFTECITLFKMAADISLNVGTLIFSISRQNRTWPGGRCWEYDLSFSLGHSNSFADRVTVPRGRLNIKISSYQYRDPQVKDKTVSRPSYL